jgi:hypothetical protein
LYYIPFYIFLTLSANLRGIINPFDADTQLEMLSQISKDLTTSVGFHDNSTVTDPSVDILIKWIQGESVDLAESILSVGINIITLNNLITH